MAEKAVLLDSINPGANSEFQAAGYEVATFPKSVSQQELRDLCEGATILGVRSGPAVMPAALSDSLEVVGVFGVGTNHITRSVPGAGKTEGGVDQRGIALFNAAHENTRSVAELVIASTLALSRGLGDHNIHMHSGIWTKEDGQEIRDKTLGIIGYGAIGGQVANMAQALDMDVVAYDPAPQIPPQGRTKMLSSVEEVLAVSDAVTLHIPGGDKNRHLINADTIKVMKQGSFLINAARGELVDYEAARAALESGWLGGLAADVYDDKAAGISEPSKKGESFDHVLRGVKNVLLMPHIGGSTKEAQTNIGRSVALKALAYLATGSTVGSVNIPALSLNGLESGHSRLLNIHHNHPGVLAQLTSLLAEAGLNVADTYHKVSGELGYVALDIEGAISQDVFTEVQTMDATRRAKIIEA